MNSRRIIAAVLGPSVVFALVAIFVYSDERAIYGMAGDSRSPNLRPGELLAGILSPTPTPTPRLLPLVILWPAATLTATPAALLMFAPTLAPTVAPIAAPSCSGIGYDDDRGSQPIVHWETYPRGLRVCLYRFPENAEVAVVARNMNTLEGFTKRVTTGPQGSIIDLRWPGETLGGQWNVAVVAEDSVHTNFVVISDGVASTAGPGLNLTPTDFRNPLRLSPHRRAYPIPSCEFAYSYHRGDMMSISGSGYPAMTEMEVGIYSLEVSTAGGGPDRVSHWSIQSDSRGKVNLLYQIPEGIAPGSYTMLAAYEDKGTTVVGWDRMPCLVVDEGVAEGSATWKDAFGFAQPATTACDGGQCAPNARTPRFFPFVHPIAAVTVRDADLHAGPDKESRRFFTLEEGTEITVVGSNWSGDWYQLDSGDWIDVFSIRLHATSLQSSSRDSDADLPPLAAAATQMLSFVNGVAQVQSTAHINENRVYSFFGAQGQSLQIQLLSTPSGANFELRGANTLYKSFGDPTLNRSFTLPESQDYRITVNSSTPVAFVLIVTLGAGSPPR